MSDTADSKYINNPKTGRMCLRNSQTGRRVLKLQQCDQPAEPVEPAESVEPAKVKLAEIGTNIIKKNKSKLAKCKSDADMDQLLKKLLYAKLCGSDPPKNKKKKKKKIVTPPSSDDSQSESDSS
jgi:hypothetical protein